MLIPVLLALTMQIPSPEPLSAWKNVPRRQRVQFGMPFLKNIQPKDLKTAPVVPTLGATMPSLGGLCFESHVIAIGTFEGVLRYGNLPLGSSNMEQEIVYAFHVEKYLKGNNGSWLKVRQPGGPLPWNLAGQHEGIGYRLENNPIPITGSRYIVFLKDPNLEFPAFIKTGFVSRKRGDAQDVHFYMDEMRFADGLQGKMCLDSGKVGFQEKPWRFDIGQQILGKTESEAVKLLSSLIADDVARLKKYDDFTEQKYGVRPDR